MQLVIAEKPSVARDLARVLGVRASGRHALEGPDRVITWCIGHLVELEEPASYDPRWKAWRMDTLPMVPAAFKLRPVAGTRDQLRVVCDLLRARRFSEVVNACDAGREGELIFRYVYDLAGSRLAVRRLWISSLTDEAIRQGFAALRPGATYNPLADAARCRSEADWLVGMNATRAVTIQFRAGNVAGPPGAGRGARGKSMPPVYSIGRVQTPTLAILVRREQAIRAFQPRDYWEVRGTFATETAAAGAAVAPGADASRRAAAGDGRHTFTALWTRRGHSEKGAVTRFGVRVLADQVLERIRHSVASGPRGGPTVESLTEKRTREPAPQLFDLTSLQRTANRRFGFSATRTLEAAQALYERHKVLTYPRTDSRYLPQDLVGELPKLFAGLAKAPLYAAFAAPLLAAGLAAVARGRRIFDGSKVHDHHAIIPTAKAPAAGALGADEQRIYDLVVRRFLGVFYPDAEFALTEAVILVGEAPPDAVEARPTDVPPATVPAIDANVPGAAAPKRGDEGARAAAAGQASGEASEEPMLTVLPPPPDRFIARGRVRLVAGWQAVAGFDERPPPATRAGPGRDGGTVAAPSAGKRGTADGDGAESTLPRLIKGQRLEGRFEALPHQTRPPPRHTEATLLGAMESAGREMEDETLRAAMKDTGLGTPATRAATIETLVKRGFVARDGKQVTATPTGISLIERLPVTTLASPELTGAWEARLVRIARGQETRAAFMTDIVEYIRQVMAAVRGGMHPGSAPPLATVDAPAATAKGSPAKPPAAPSGKGGAVGELPCPLCRQGSLIAGNRGWGCSRWREGCRFVIWFDVAGKRITATQLRDLVEKGKTRKFKVTVLPVGSSAASAASVPSKDRTGRKPVTGWLVLDLSATREQGAARFSPA